MMIFRCSLKKECYWFHARDGVMVCYSPKWKRIGISGLSSRPRFDPAIHCDARRLEIGQKAFYEISVDDGWGRRIIPEVAFA
jgi:hypothetical protein